MGLDDRPAERQPEAHAGHRAFRPPSLERLKNLVQAIRRKALAGRREQGLPPYAHLAILRAESREQQAALTLLQELKHELLREHRTVQIIGPVPAPMQRRAGLHRLQLLLSHAQRALLDKHAPERLSLANGRTPKVSYAAGNPPHISLRIQELYDVNQTPKIALGRVPMVVHILTPGMKPIQITQDLANFWREQYPKIKAELQRKYPRHEWR